MKNLTASILSRLKNSSRSEGRAYNLVLEEYAIARLIARLSASPYRERFVLKGAQLFKLWASSSHRPTRDADFLSFGTSTPKALEEVFEEICALETDPSDALEWTVDSAAQIREDNLYGGVRIRLTAHLAKVRIPAQVDVGFGDSVTPEAVTAEWPMPLGFPKVPIHAYCPETSIAEKFHAAVVLDTSNSRMKDFFDIHWLSLNCGFEYSRLESAIQATFHRRDTDLPEKLPIAYTASFWTSPDKQIQWKAFLRKSSLAPIDFGEVMEQISRFLSPLFSKDNEARTWNPESGWTP